MKIRFRPQVEELEPRAVPAAIGWVGGDFIHGSPDQWEDASNWNPQQVPSSADDVTIDGSRTFQPIIYAGDAEAVRSLIDSGNGSLTVKGTLDLAGAATTDWNGSKPIDVRGTLNVDPGCTLTYEAYSFGTTGGGFVNVEGGGEAQGELDLETDFGGFWNSQVTVSGNLLYSSTLIQNTRLYCDLTVGGTGSVEFQTGSQNYGGIVPCFQSPWGEIDDSGTMKDDASGDVYLGVPVRVYSTGAFVVQPTTAVEVDPNPSGYPSLPYSIQTAGLLKLGAASTLTVTRDLSVVSGGTLEACADPGQALPQTNVRGNAWVTGGTVELDYAGNSSTGYEFVSLNVSGNYCQYGGTFSTCVGYSGSQSFLSVGGACHINDDPAKADNATMTVTAVSGLRPTDSWIVIAPASGSGHFASITGWFGQGASWTVRDLSWSGGGYLITPTF